MGRSIFARSWSISARSSGTLHDKFELKRIVVDPLTKHFGLQTKRLMTLAPALAYRAGGRRRVAELRTEGSEVAGDPSGRNRPRGFDGDVPAAFLNADASAGISAAAIGSPPVSTQCREGNARTLSTTSCTEPSRPPDSTRHTSCRTMCSGDCIRKCGRTRTECLSVRPRPGWNERSPR